MVRSVIQTALFAAAVAWLSHPELTTAVPVPKKFSFGTTISESFATTIILGNGADGAAATALPTGIASSGDDSGDSTAVGTTVAVTAIATNGQSVSTTVVAGAAPAATDAAGDGSETSDNGVGDGLGDRTADEGSGDVGATAAVTATNGQSVATTVIVGAAPTGAASAGSDGGLFDGFPFKFKFPFRK
ncbi:hypothetical protein C8F01DRAFT_1257353 [Mycena amicta]|nr:hypothetical protein C8F01DRAFT_1257353 [Mycena amicta]